MSDVLPDTRLGKRIRQLLNEARAVWLTTTAADGTPQPNPVWFLWDDEDGSILVYSQRNAHRLRHIARNSRVSLNFDGEGNIGSPVSILLGTAQSAPNRPSAAENQKYLAKYETDMAGISGSVAAFSEAYPDPLEITVDRVRGF